MATTTTSTMDGFLATHLNRQLLKFEAGHAIFCPRCQEVMDCRRTVVVTVHRHLAGREEKCCAKYVQCGKCWDKAKDKAQAAVAKTAAEHPELNARMEVVDGRELWKRAR